MNLHGATALVTGGAHRVGKAIALALAHEGARVIITFNTSAEKAQATVVEINRSGGQARAFQCDQRDLVAIDRLFDQLRAEFDQIDLLVNSAAIMEQQAVLDITPDDWARVMETNLRGPFFMAQAAAKWMAARGNHGSIVNIADMSALYPWPNYLTHTLSKTGMVAMTKALALALAPNVRVNAIAPGTVLKPKDWDEMRWQKLVTALPLQHAGMPEDVGEAVLFCARSEFMTGQVLALDGGRSLKP